MLNEVDNPMHAVCDCCSKAICLSADCYSPSCPEDPGRRCDKAELCADCAAEWENEEKALRAVARVLGSAA